MEHTYDYYEIKSKLKNQKQEVLKKLQSHTLNEKEKESLLTSVDNCQYILDLVEMNHFCRGV
jgi:6-pyruvoyl-tetrahydropterin synthase